MARKRPEQKKSNQKKNQPKLKLADLNTRGDARGGALNAYMKMKG